MGSSLLVSISTHPGRMGHLSVGRYYPVRIEPGDSPGLVTKSVFSGFFHIKGGAN